MDISNTLLANSNQLNAVDLIAGPATFRIERVDVKPGEQQPVHVHLTGMSGRPWKPSKGMRRVLAEGWSADSSTWVGQSVTLYREPSVKYAGEAVGGIRVSAMTGLDEPLVTRVRLNKSGSEKFTVQPLSVASGTDWAGLVHEAGDDVEALRAIYKDASENNAGKDVLGMIAAAANSVQAGNDV